MAALEKAGAAQTRKTYARHGAPEPMFGVSYAVLKTLVKRIGVDHELALALWATGNFDARNLAVKVADPSSPVGGGAEPLDPRGRVPMLGELRRPAARLGGPPRRDPGRRDGPAPPRTPRCCAAWALIGQMALRDATTPDAWFEGRLPEIERTIHSAPNDQRDGHEPAADRDSGCRSAALREGGEPAAAKRIGKVEVDHGDTACKTPDAAAYIEKTWAHSTSKGFKSPAAHERSREPMRVRC